MRDTPLLGKLVYSKGQQRDAVHVAIVSVIAGEDLQPGQHVGIVSNADEIIVASSRITSGIVDPYLRCKVETGQRFWLLLYPNTVTGLRHVWTHPDFKDSHTDDAVEYSKEWMREFAEEYRSDYETLLGLGYQAINETWVDCGDNESLSSRLNRNNRDFFRHWSVITGEPSPEDDHQIFTCGC